MENKERLQKVLARAGIASRRKAELLILEGVVTVNGRPATELGTKVDASRDKIKVNGKLIFTETEPVYVLFYKPVGVISSLSDPEGRKNIGQFIRDIREKVMSIGRLDYNSEGLILLTNDGALAEKIQKTRGLSKVYMVKVKGFPGEEDLARLKKGIYTKQGVVLFKDVSVVQKLARKSWLKLEIIEGSKLNIRELLNHRGLLVDRIVRTAIGDIELGRLKPGEHRFVRKREFQALVA